MEGENARSKRYERAVWRQPEKFSIAVINSGGVDR